MTPLRQGKAKKLVTIFTLDFLEMLNLEFGAGTGRVGKLKKRR